MNGMENYETARKIFKEQVDAHLNDPTAFSGYARALGHVEGLVISMMFDIPAVQDYIIERYPK